MGVFSSKEELIVEYKRMNVFIRVFGTLIKKHPENIDIELSDDEDAITFDIVNMHEKYKKIHVRFYFDNNGILIAVAQKDELYLKPVEYVLIDITGCKSYKEVYDQFKKELKDKFQIELK